MKKFLLLTIISLMGVLFNSALGQDVVTIDGTTTEFQSGTQNSLPFNTYNTASLSQQIYLKEEIKRENGGSIQSIAFYHQQKDSNSQDDVTYPYTCDITVYLKNISADFDEFSSTTTELMSSTDKVFEGYVTLNENEWFTITLDDEFAYTGGNILLYVFEDSDTDYTGKTKFHTLYTEKTCRSLYKNSNIDGTPETTTFRATRSYHVSQIKFTFATSGTTTPTPPTAPTLNAPANNATDVFNEDLKFTLGSRTEQYQIVMGSGTSTSVVQDWTNGSSGDVVSFKPQVNYNGTTYSWKVVARCSDGGTGYLTTESDTWSFTTRNVTSVPDAPTLTSPAHESSTDQNPLLSWDFGANTEEYKVLLGSDENNLAVVKDYTNTNNAASGSYQTSNLNSGVYYWQIVAKNSMGETPSAIYSFTKVGAPNNVTNVYPTDGATGVSPKVTLTWDFDPATTHYRVLMDLGNGAFEYVAGNQWIATNGATTGSFDASGENLNVNTSYSWCVDVKNSVGEKKYYDGDGSIAIFSFKTASEVVEKATGLTSTLNLYDATLRWNYGSNNAVNEYQVLLGTDPNNMSVVQDWTARKSEGTGFVTSENIVKTGLEAGTTYYWQVNVRKDGGDVLSSNIASFTTDSLPEKPVYTSPADDANVDSDPELKWTFGAHTSEYMVLLGTDENNMSVVQDWTSSLAASYQTSGLAANVVYYWQVVVRNNMGEVKGDVYSFTKATLPDNVTPISPADGETDVSNVVTITWEFAPGTTHYKVLLDEGYGMVYMVGDANKWVSTNEASTGSASFELELGKTYSWCVDVANDAGSRIYYYYPEGSNPNKDQPVPQVETFSFTTSTIGVPKYVTPADESVLTTNTAMLQWNYGNRSTATHYQVLYGTDKDNLAVKQDWTERPGEGTNLVSTGSLMTEALTDNTKYYWQVKVKQGVDGEVMEGAVWSFISMLDVPQNVKADNDSIYTDTAHLTWDAIADASGYKVYVNGEYKETVSTNSADVTGLTYNGGAFNNIQVTALYDLDGESYESAKSATVKVMVIGYGKIQIIVQDYKGNRVEGVTITLTGKDAFGNDGQFTFTTNAQGEYTSPAFEVYTGTYTAEISKANYLTTTVDNVVITYNETYDFGLVTLHSNFIFDVTIREADFEHLEIMLGYASGEAFQAGDYNLYIRNEETGEIEELGKNFFSTSDLAPEFAQLWYTDWAYMLNGTYSFGVEVPGSGIINWTNNTTIRDYYIFDYEGDWTDQTKWRGEEMPTDADDEVFLLQKATINEGETIHVGKVNIKKVSSISTGIYYYGALIVKGTLISSDGIENGGGAKDFILYDGAQLRQAKGYALTQGRFIMNIDNPTEWSVWNKTGWQFISSPFTDAKISDFTNANDEYDLYKFDGDHENLKVEWRNHKALKDDPEDPFETTFVSGRGYMASYKTNTTATLEGQFNSASSWTYAGITYQEIQEGETHWPNFHLVGNPFSFDMDLSNLKTSSLATGIAYVNEVGGFDYMTTGTVKVGDGFFVRTVGTTPSCSYSESATRGDDNEPADNINITVSGKNTRDNVVLNFAGADKAGFPKMENFNEDVPCIYINSEAKRWGIFNYDRDVKEVALSFETKKMGNYTISINPEGEYENITLVDRLTGIETNMLLEDYNFTATTSMKDNADRFIVRFALKSDIEEETEYFAYQSGDELIINAEGAVQIFDVTGRVVYSDDVENANRRINVGKLGKAAYILRLINDEGVKVQKVIIY